MVTTNDLFGWFGVHIIDNVMATFIYNMCVVLFGRSISYHNIE